MTTIKTYRDLKKALESLTEDQLNQRLQICDDFQEDITELKPIIAIGTVSEFELPGSRSCVDNKYHSNELIMLVDHNPFDKDGAIAYELNTGGITEINDFLGTPIYGKYGQITVEEQTAPKNPNHKKEESFDKIIATIIASRSEQYREIDKL